MPRDLLHAMGTAGGDASADPHVARAARAAPSRPAPIPSSRSPGPSFSAEPHVRGDRWREREPGCIRCRDRRGARPPPDVSPPILRVRRCRAACQCRAGERGRRRSGHRVELAVRRRRRPVGAVRVAAADHVLRAWSCRWSPTAGIRCRRASSSTSTARSREFTLPPITDSAREIATTTVPLRFPPMTGRRFASHHRRPCAACDPRVHRRHRGRPGRDRGARDPRTARHARGRRGPRPVPRRPPLDRRAPVPVRVTGRRAWREPLGARRHGVRSE